MQLVNLVDELQSDITYKISKMPDGQQQVTLGNVDQKVAGKLIDPGPHTYAYQTPNQAVKIVSRLNNFMDFELIACTVASLRNAKVKEIHLSVPYFLGARSDRKFEDGGNNYLRDVICPLINSLKFDSVTVLDPHSDCLEMGLNGYQKVDNCEFVKWALTKINNKNDAQENTVFVSPDAGAAKKIFKVAEYVYFKGDVLICSKDRGSDGKINKTVVPMKTDKESLNKDYVIIDDIADGSRTFINIAKEIKSYELFTGKIYLVVTHGIFSKGFEELAKYFDGIYCTNSYARLEQNELGDSWIGSTEEQYWPEIPKGLVKQLNIF